MSARMTLDDLLERFARRGLPDSETAMRAVRSTLAVLGERLVDDEAAALAGVLPAELATSLERVEYDADFGSADLYERVGRRELTTAGDAKEHAEIVIGALGELLDDDLRMRLARALPRQVGAVLLGRPAFGEPPPHRMPSRAPTAPTTLAMGCSGSRHPLCEATAPAGQTHSVACNPSPHDGTKLSTSRGLTQERLHESLADSRRS